MKAINHCVSKAKEESPMQYNITRRQQHRLHYNRTDRRCVQPSLLMILCLLLLVITSMYDINWCTNAFISIITPAAVSRRNLYNNNCFGHLPNILPSNYNRRCTLRKVSENISGGNNDPMEDAQKQIFSVNGSSTSNNSNNNTPNNLPVIETSSSSSTSPLLSTVIGASSTSTAIGTTSNTKNPPFLVTLDDASQHSYTEAIQRTIGWVSAAIIFGTTLWITNDAQTGEEFFAGYIVEQSLSIDNLFVFLLLFEYFQVPIQYQDRVLNWGIYGAIVMRAIMIGLGAAALQNFHAILLVFAAILVYSSISFFIKTDDDEEEDPSKNFVVQFSRSLFPSTDQFDEDRFFTTVNNIRTATPLFICMIAIEISDVVFAVDSIPAVFGVTEVRSFVLGDYCYICSQFVKSQISQKHCLIFFHASKSESLDCI
jgi:predicted tellurium resistance membrane protein TerC